MSAGSVHSFTEYANSCFLHLNVTFCCLSFQVIMWMLRTGRGMLETVFKIIKFFPSKLPQYQDQCVSVLQWNCIFVSL